MYVERILKAHTFVFYCRQNVNMVQYIYILYIHTQNYLNVLKKMVLYDWTDCRHCMNQV